MKSILLIVTNVEMYASGRLKTGLWLSELTHIYHSAKEKGWNITIASPRGGMFRSTLEALNLWY